ncbi:MAG: 50S ribosomal protein L32 [Candidatus Alcyoniella australis]|nr:50S ribosomal protein L32 [Candidatus Alcyoniella australis]
MPVPKRKVSKARRDKRRTHQKIAEPTTMLCPECGEPAQPHHACPHCGMYKGRQVIEAEEE